MWSTNNNKHNCYIFTESMRNMFQPYDHNPTLHQKIYSGQWNNTVQDLLIPVSQNDVQLFKPASI